MKKNDNHWSIRNLPPINGERLIQIELNTMQYVLDEPLACFAHALLLLVDAINDKRISNA